MGPLLPPSIFINIDIFKGLLGREPMWFLGTLSQKKKKKSEDVADVCVSFGIQLLNLCFQRNAKSDLEKSNSVGKECNSLNLQQTCFIKTTKLFIL